MNARFNRVPVSLLFCVLVMAAPMANSQDALRGKTLYQTTNGAPLPCADAGCHGPDPTKDKSGILKGANNAGVIHTAIVSKVATMKFLTAYVSTQDELDLAAYLGNPNVSATPNIAVAPTALTFASTYVGSVSAVASATVSNSGTANLVLSSLGLSGTNAAEFRLEPTSTCTGGSTLVPGASCRVNLTFRPTSTGAKAANLALAHNAAAGTTLVPVSGTASPAPTPSITVSPTAITFPSMTAGGSSAVYSVTAANTGTAALIFSAISTLGVNANDFKIEPTSTCSVSASVAPGGSCQVDLTFKPTVLGSLTASLAMVHNAPGGTSSVALNGTATAAPTPTIALSASSLSFGPQEVGTQGALQTITVTNVGSAALNMSALTAGGSHVADFTRSGTCQAGMTLAATGGNCTLAFAFAPTAVGARTSSLTIASNNAGGNVTVTLSGNATTNVPAAFASPASLSFGTQQIGTSSAPQQVTVSNTGGGRLSITALAFSSPHFTQSGNCVAASLAAGQSCTVNVVFAPTASGSLTSSLSISHGAAASPLSIALSGVGSTQPVPVVQASPSAVSFPGVTVVGQPSAVQSITVSSAGPGGVTLTALVASTNEFVIAGGSPGNCAAGMIVAQGASCTIDVHFTPSASGARAGSLGVASNGTPSVLSIALTGDATSVASPGISSDRNALNFGPIAVAAQSAAQQVWVTNTGSTNLDVTAVSVGAPFTLAPGGTCAAATFSLTPGQSCMLQVQFAPIASGSHAGTLSFASNAGSLAVALTGEGIATAAANQNVTSVGTPVNEGGGGGVGLICFLTILALGTLARRRLFG
jgi:hypothetical protein